MSSVLLALPSPIRLPLGIVAGARSGRNGYADDESILIPLIVPPLFFLHSS